MRYILALGVITATALAGATDVVNIVNGGEKVQADDEIAKYTVALQRSDASCSATIVAEDLLLTAAHCLPMDTIHFGIESKAPVDTRPVKQAMPHSKYDATANERNRYDIALVSFEGGLPKGFAVMPIAGPGFRPQNGDKILAAGFGHDLINGTLGFLKKVELEVMDADHSESEILLRQTYKNGVCNGDSGGPGFMKDSKGYVLVAVANAVANDGRCGQMALHALPNAHLDWLTEAAASLRNGLTLALAM